MPWAVQVANFSTQMTLAPASAAEWVATTPAMPAPMTTTSTVSSEAMSVMGSGWQSQG